jgi:hypothetical protein
VLAVALSRRRQANVFEHSASSRGRGMGGADPTGDNHVASYFNPSMLPLGKEFSFGLGVSWAQPVTDVHAQAKADDDYFVRNRPPAPPSFAGLTLGVVFPFGGKLQNHLALGLALYAPTTTVIRSQSYSPESRPGTSTTQARPPGAGRRAGAARPVPRLALPRRRRAGAGRVPGRLRLPGEPLHQEFEQRALDNSLALKAAPIAGLTLDFAEVGLRVGFSYRGELDLHYDMPTTFDIADVGTLDLVMSGHVHYTPHILSLGLRWAIGPVVTSAELRYALWSQAPDPAVHVGMTLDSEIATALGLEGRFDAMSPEEPPGFSDTLEPHGGVEWYVVPGSRCAGLLLPPDPGAQAGRRHQHPRRRHPLLRGRPGLQLRRPLEVFTKPVHVDLAYQFMWIPDRRADKGSTSTVPSYVYGGYAHNVTAAVRYAF